MEGREVEVGMATCSVGWGFSAFGLLETLHRTHKGWPTSESNGQKRRQPRGGGPRRHYDVGPTTPKSRRVTVGPVQHSPSLPNG